MDFAENSKVILFLIDIGDGEYKGFCVESYLKKGCNPIVSWNNSNTRENEAYDEMLDKMGR